MRELMYVFGALKMTYGAVNAAASVYKGQQAKGQIGALYKQCYETNVKHRGIIQANEYTGKLEMLKDEVYLFSPSSDEVRIALLPSKKIGTMQSSIITGGKSVIRNRSAYALINDALDGNIPVIVVHCDNGGLSQTLCNGSNGYRVNIVERDHLSYNPFFGMNSLEIGRMLFDSIPDKYQVKFAARDIISVMSEVIFARGIVPSPATLASCPIFNLTELINKMVDMNIIQRPNAERLISDYMVSQNETRALAHYLMDLGAQLKRMTNDNGVEGCDTLKALNNGDAVLINISSNSNELAIGLVTNHLKLLIDQGHQFLLMLDGIDLTKYKPLLELALHNQTGFVLSYDDIFSSAGGDEKIFSSITGSVGKVIIHATASGFSCTQWSKYLGDYERHEPKSNINIGQQGMIGSNVSQGTSVDIKREARVPPEVINQLQGAQACIYDGASNRIMFVDIV
jgi:hypothetical protein